MKRTMSKEEFLALYKRQQSSGLTIKDFCDNESYPASCFHYWKKKYGLSHPYTKHTEPTGDSFIPLNINHTPAIPTSSCGDRRVTIELPSGIKIHLNILSNPEIIYVFDYVTKSKKSKTILHHYHLELNFFLCCFLFRILGRMFTI